jgi:cytochrome c biogenesis protein CcmG, thiol:disulfide interchange protein DsbE
MSRTVASKSSAAGRRKTIIYVTIAVVVIAVIVGIGLASRQVVPQNATEAIAPSKLKAGDTAPAFSVQTPAGPFTLANASTPVLLEVFATWCPHCQRETKVLNDLSAKYGDKVVIIGVSGDAFDMAHQGPETQADVNTFGQQFGVRYPLAFDPNLTVAKQYLKDGFPTIAVIDKNKKITWIKGGEAPESELVKQLNRVI